MQKWLSLLTIAAALALVPAAARADVDIYTTGGAMLTDWANPDMDNTGLFGEIGVTNGTLAGGFEILNHCHLGDCTLAGAVNGRVFIGPWAVQPYLVAGIGMTFEGDPLGKYGAGLIWQATPDFAIYAGYEAISYFEDFNDMGDLDNWSESTDDFVKAGIWLTF